MAENIGMERATRLELATLSLGGRQSVCVDYKDSCTFYETRFPFYVP